MAVIISIILFVVILIIATKNTVEEVTEEIAATNTIENAVITAVKPAIIKETIEPLGFYEAERADKKNYGYKAANHKQTTEWLNHRTYYKRGCHDYKYKDKHCAPIKKYCYDIDPEWG